MSQIKKTEKQQNKQFESTDKKYQNCLKNQS